MGRDVKWIYLTIGISLRRFLLTLTVDDPVSRALFGVRGSVFLVSTCLYRYASLKDGDTF